MCTFEKFLAKYAFLEEGKGLLGAEIEFFLTKDRDSFEPVPQVAEFLERMDKKVWGYELSACQVEYHTNPAKTVAEVVADLRAGWRAGVARASEIGRVLVAKEVAPANMSLAVYEEDARYVALAKTLPENVLRAACQVAGTHLHIGVGNFSEALCVYNKLAEYTEEFIVAGDHSNGERIRLYQVMAPNARPPRYASLEQLYETAKDQRFVDDPRSCYHFVRFNPKGTVEIRAYGTTNNFEEVRQWLERIREILE